MVAFGFQYTSEARRPGAWPPSAHFHDYNQVFFTRHDVEFVSSDPKVERYDLESQVNEIVRNNPFGVASDVLGVQ